MFKRLKREKWEKENLKALEEKDRNLRMHKKETKKYRGIEYDLICLESYSGGKWVALENCFRFPKNLIYELNQNGITGDHSLYDFLWYDSLSWDKFPIEYQWKKMDKIAKLHIDGLYEIHENIDSIIATKIRLMKVIKNNLRNFIETIEREVI